MIDVLLSTYNGADYLPAQLDSLLGQVDVDLRVIARDDGSTDGTMDVLVAAAQAHPGRVVVLDKEAPRNLGVKRSFSKLLEASTAAYIALADQDDVWRKDKLALLQARLLDLESRHGVHAPLLVHSDLAVVDRNMLPLAPSFWQVEGIDPARNRCHQLLMQNTVTGCASLFNRALVNKALPIPDEAEMHDHWLALVASIFGHIEPLPIPLVSYRQHGGNVVGARKRSFWNAVSSLASRWARGELTAWDHARWMTQGKAVLNRFGTDLPAPTREMLEAFVQMPLLGFLERRRQLVKHRLWTANALYNVYLFIRL